MTFTTRNIADMIEHHADDRVEVLAQDHRDAVARKAGPGEHRFDQERVAEHSREVEADDGQRRDQRGPERIAARDAPLRKTVGLRHFDIGLGVGLDHVGAGQARRLPDAGERQREGRQRDVPERIAEGREIAGKQRIDEQEVGARRDVDRIGNAAGDRE